ncbi:hypothetical protein QFC19_008694 [Naganishia cerealis]|uniref:Uncharacterized protein n=1 Tax=Naganishia cerealis TaxID=610337 RepID=A0ACC2V0P1_9TREE|nr:hypothetical protein QFC19_008694 [Naganishia cerealis]
MQTSSIASAPQPLEPATTAQVAIRSSDDKPESSQQTISHAANQDSGREVRDAEKLDSASRGVDAVTKKKRAGSSDGQEDGGEKGRRPCDMCRKRKADNDGIKCRGCLNLDIPCTYLYVNKRPGRPSKKDLENVEKEKEKPGQGVGKDVGRGQKVSKGKQKKEASGAGRTSQQKPGTYASGSATTLPSPGPGPSFAATRPASATTLPSQQSQAKYLSPKEPTMTTLFSPTVDLETHTRPEKRQRTESQHSHRSQEHQQPSAQFDASFSWTPGLSIGSFGDSQKEDEYDGQRYRSHSQNQGQTADLFGHVRGYTPHPNTYQAINNEVGTNFNGSGPTPSYAGQMNLGENERSLQPFVPDFASFTGMNPNKPAEERVYTNQGSQSHQHQGHAGFSFLATSASVPTQSENTEPNQHFQHQSYLPHREDGSYPNHSHTQPYPDQPALVHHRASASHQPPGSVLMPDAFQDDTTASNGKISAAPLPACPQIEDVTSWSNVSFFISLHLRYQHAIMPIIHKPTFNNDLALRLDRKDEMFRAFLLSLGKYDLAATSPMDTDVYGILRWIERAQAQMRKVIQGLPDVLGPAPPHVTMAVTDQSEVFATQRANLLITAVSAEFALLDLKALADPTHDISSERELVGREMYSLLSSIPVEHLAANGESMRGKVLRIIIALLSNSASPEHWNQHVRDWWDIYSKVQFVQMIPMNVDLLLGSTNTL